MSRFFDINGEEQTSALAVNGRHLTTLKKLGVADAAMAAIGAKQTPFGVQRCDMRGKQFFEPTREPYGVDAVIMPVVAEGTTIDLISWRTLAPDAWLWRNGDGWALGIDIITSPPLWDGFQEITLHATPLDWLRAGGTGAVILDWAAVPHIRRLAMFDTILCDHPTVQKRLASILNAPERKPKIIAAGTRHGRAA